MRDVLCRIVDDLEATPIADLTGAFDEPLRDIMFEMMAETIGLQEQKGAEFSALTHRFPLLKSNPPEDFIEAAFLHFLDVLELNALEEELASELAVADDEIDEHSWLRIQALTQDLSRRREECARDEGDLAERAKKIRTAPPAAVAMWLEISVVCRPGTAHCPFSGGRWLKKSLFPIDL